MVVTSVTTVEWSQMHVTTFNASVTAMAKGGQWRGAVDVFKDMALFNVISHVHHLNSAHRSTPSGTVASGGRPRRPSKTWSLVEWSRISSLLTALGNDG